MKLLVFTPQEINKPQSGPRKKYYIFKFDWIIYILVTAMEKCYNFVKIFKQRH